MEYCPYCMNCSEADSGICNMCGNMINKEIPTHHLAPGTILNKKILVGGVLGEGGFGITYIGRDLNLEIKVAIKEYYPYGYVNRNALVSSNVTYSISADSMDFFKKGRERFLGEARILAKFSGEPGIVEVRDFFEENNTAYIIMEYLEGKDLKQFLAENGTLTPEYTISMLTPIMNALAKIHKQGLIHRDISPDNIRLTGGKAKLLDFGAARGVSAISNKSLSVMLKPGFAPEEQYRSKGNQGAWTDVYALCATIYKCITGITPDDSTQRVFCDELQTPTALGFKIDSDIESALMKGLAVLQKDRYQSVEELLNGFRGIDISVQGDERTVSAGIPVSEDDIETRYIASEEDTTVHTESEISVSDTEEASDKEEAVCTTGNVVVEDDTQTQYLDESQLVLQADEYSAENSDIQQIAEEAVDGFDEASQNEELVVSVTGKPVAEDDTQTQYLDESQLNMQSDEDSVENTDAKQIVEKTVDSSDETTQNEDLVAYATGISVAEDDTQTQYLDKSQLNMRSDEDSAENTDAKQIVEETVDNSDEAEQNEAVADVEETPVAQNKVHTEMNQKKKPSRVKKVLLPILGLAIVGIVATVIITNVIRDSKKVTITLDEVDSNGNVVISNDDASTGKNSITIKGDASNLIFESKSFDEEDIKKLATLENVWSATFINCNFAENSIQYLAESKSDITCLKMYSCTGLDAMDWLSEMTGLRELRIANVGLSDDKLKKIDFSNHTRLKVVDISHNSVTFLDAFECMTTIEEFYCDETRVYDFSCLKNCTSLWKLSARSSRAGLYRADSITHISSSLRYLDLSECYIYNLDVFGKNSADFSKLQTLLLEYTQITDLFPLARIDSLQTLDVSHNGITNLTGINKTAKLKHLNASNCGLLSIDALSGITTLETLDLSCNELESIEALSACDKLVAVDLSQNKIGGKLSELLKSKDTLKCLDLGYNDTTLEVPKELLDTAKLEYINFGNSLVGADLSNCKSLKYIIADSPVEKITFGELWTNNLKYVDLCTPKVENLQNIFKTGNSFDMLDLSSDKWLVYFGDLLKWGESVKRNISVETLIISADDVNTCPYEFKGDKVYIDGFKEENGIDLSKLSFDKYIVLSDNENIYEFFPSNTEVVNSDNFELYKMFDKHSYLLDVKRKYGLAP